ncbi:Thioesterase superfamily [Ascosphaera apis ARSEF 7405]|uniref:Thioesterase superfamily n=1 Tax=Ascosphaera apis ARSEF 7405 TaxID=392613 RepID=A0A168CSH1_9EURO|nr:Thioesterase superfamily [Ascosphaera apis ARSEF 7405]
MAAEEKSFSNSAMEAVVQMWERQKVKSPVYSFMLRDVVITHAEPGLFKARIKASEEHMNSHNGLHGVFSACVTDWSGGLAIATHGWQSTGVSVDIHVTYLSTAKIGDMLEIEATADRVGRNLAFTSVNVWKIDGDEKKLVAKGTHTKYVANAVRPIA